MKINNVDVSNADAFVDEVKKDKTKALKTKNVEADGPPFMGGSGIKPDPVQYCLFGLAACYAQTFASVAAEKGIKLNKLKVAAENKVNLIKALGLSDEPIVEKV